MQLTPNIVVSRDAAGRIRGLNHLQDPYLGDKDHPPAEIAVGYLRETADLFQIAGDVFLDPAGRLGGDLRDARPQLVVAETTRLMGTTTVGFAEYVHGIQLWEAGASVVVEDSSARVLSARSEYDPEPKVALLDPDAVRRKPRLSVGELARALDVDSRKFGLKLNTKEPRWWLYRFEPSLRHHPESMLVGVVRTGREQGPPTLDLPEVNRVIEAGVCYPVVEARFQLAVPRWGDLNWRAFLEPVTRSILYLRALVACADGRVYLTDPTVQTGNVSLRANAATTTDLDAERRLVTLPGLDGPAAGAQNLRGEFVEIRDTDSPTVAPPAEGSPFRFSYSAPTDDFAATATYFHCDAAFRLVQDLGFDIDAYFDDTTFPVPVDHRGRNDVNASCEGNAAGNGVGKFRFGPCDTGTTVGMGSEGRTVLHEFGHALLWDSVSSPNFGFAHSAGDALAMIVTDPVTQITGADRFIVFTFCPLSTHRRADRDVASGWAWGGSRDVGSYSSEEILTTTLFRVYQSLGGDSTRAEAREFASRYVSYLIIRAIGSLATSPVTPTPLPDDFATALMTADRGTTDFEGYSGGFLHKVMRWSFEKQGLYQPPGASTPVTTAGAPPDVDVYIDDGRNGDYQFRENFWDTTDIWNRRSADSGTTHEDPVVGVENHVYVRVKNRGRLPANNVSVRGFHSRPMTGLIWPADWEPMTTAELAASAPIASGGTEVVGPFAWTPRVAGHECLLMVVSADGDRSNVDPVQPTVTGAIPHWRLVPFDNNIAQRNVAPVEGTTRTLARSLADRVFVIVNPGKRKAIVELEVSLPRSLVKLGWRARLEGVEPGPFTLARGQTVEVRPILQPGRTPVIGAWERERPRLDVTVVMDGFVVGGMTFPLGPARRQLRTLR